MSYKGCFDEKVSKLFSKLVCTVAIPYLMITEFNESFNKHKLITLSKGLFVPFASMAICYLIAIIISKIIKVKKGRVGTFRSMFFVSNSIFIGLPVNISLFGTQSIPDVRNNHLFY